MKVYISGYYDDTTTFPVIVPIQTPSTAGYFTNFDLQLIVGDSTREDPITVSFGKSLDDAKERIQSVGSYEIADMKQVVQFTTNMEASDLANSLSSSADFKIYHFHSKKKVYVSGKFAINEFRINSNAVPASGKFMAVLLTADYVPFKNSNSLTRKNIQGLLSNELLESQALVVPFDLKNPKIRATARILSTTPATEYQLNDLYFVVVPKEYKSTFVTNTTASGETLLKAITDNRQSYGVNYVMQLPISSEDTGIATGTKYINAKLQAGDRIFAIYHESLQNAAASALEVDLEIEGQVIYSGHISYTRAVFRDGAVIIPSDLIEIFQRSILGGGN